MRRMRRRMRMMRRGMMRMMRIRRRVDLVQNLEGAPSQFEIP